MRRKPKPIRLKPKLKAWHKVIPALMARMTGASRPGATRSTATWCA